MTHSINTDISVIIVTRNREMILPACINCLLSDRAQPYEIIVVDSSSTKATENILRNYPSVIYHSIGDIPYSMDISRNVGISLARGEVVAFIDDDCFIQPGWLDELSKVFAEPDIVAAGGRIIYHPWKVCTKSNTIVEIKLDKDVIWAEWDRIPNGMMDVPTLPGGNCAVRRDVAVNVGGFDTNFIGSANLEETDFFLRVSKTGGRIVFVPTAVVEHRAAPRADNIVRSDFNFIYRYSLVRNRLFFLRKHHRSSFGTAVKHQFLHVIAGSWKMLVNLITFITASLWGILAGSCTPLKSKSEGLYKDTFQAALPNVEKEQLTVKSDTENVGNT